MAGGFLTGKYKRGEAAVCSVISGATRVEHVLSNARAADWVLTDEELKEIRSILELEF